jgi:hypothetical protein
MSIRLLLCLSLCIGKSLWAQSNYQLELNQIVMDEKGRKMQSIIAVYKYKGQPFIDPALIGVAGNKEPKKFYAKMPNMTGINDTNYAYIFYGGTDQRKDLKGYSLMIIGNNQRSIKPALLWIDKNHNLDLSDDGAPDTFYYNTPDKDITLAHPKQSTAQYTVNISRFSFSYNSKYLGMLDEYYKNNSGPPAFSGALYSFKEQRLNTIAGDYNNGIDSFRIGIKDVNCNGFYNDWGIDQLIIGNYKSELPDQSIVLENKKQNMRFVAMGKAYTIQSIHPIGAFIEFSAYTGNEVITHLPIGKKIKPFRYQLYNKSLQSSKALKKQACYLYFWNDQNPNFFKDTQALRTLTTLFGSKIQIITFNKGLNHQELLQFKRYGQITWPIAIATESLLKELMIGQLPYGIYCSKRLKVKQVAISPADLLILLKKQT